MIQLNKFLSRGDFVIRIGIYGYGNLGRGVELAIKQNEDMKLWRKMHDIYFAVLNSPDHTALVDALVEQMTI